MGSESAVEVCGLRRERVGWGGVEVGGGDDVDDDGRKGKE